MESQLLAQKNAKASAFISWILLASAIFSCSSRADYNIIIGFLVLFTRSQYMIDKPKFKLLTKATLHILVLSLFFDILWIWQFKSYWKHGDDTSDLWRSLSFVHNLAYFLGIFEFLVKFPVVLFLFRQFKSNGGKNNELLKFNYLPTQI